MAESGRPTTLSMLKTGMGNRHEGTRDKIAMMEAKLRQMERSKPTQPTQDTPSSLPYHASLPAKPLPSNNPSSQAPSQLARSLNEPQRQRKPPPPLPSLPLFPQSSSVPAGLKNISESGSLKSSAGSSSRKVGAAPFLGVKLRKARDKDKDGGKDVPNSRELETDG
ncbi:hypothetical protein B0H10DRAFT_309153 [Mycena sp. CBHHK59/15]|nr:hypothetical protein B0H10DRAFT_309153 [Mycena sp. CBHHK59/15]